MVLCASRDPLAGRPALPTRPKTGIIVVDAMLTEELLRKGQAGGLTGRRIVGKQGRWRWPRLRLSAFDRFR